MNQRHWEWIRGAVNISTEHIYLWETLHKRFCLNECLLVWSQVMIECLLVWSQVMIECLLVWSQVMIECLLVWSQVMIECLLVWSQVTTRKGIHRSFLSATKKWFGGSKPTNPAIITNNTNVVYVSELLSIQLLLFLLSTAVAVAAFSK